MKEVKKTFLLIIVVTWTISEGTAQIYCPPLEPPSKGRGMKVECQHNGQVTDCFAHQHWPGTVAEYNCKDFHVSSRGSPYTHVMTCNDLGAWTGSYSYNMFICTLDCGKPTLNFQKYIAGSVPTDPVYWPWHASIFNYTKRNNKIEYKCGGSLIGLNVVMTAAHCVTTENSILVILASSTSDFYSSSSDPNAQVFQATKIIIQPNFDSSTLLSDIALLVLDKDVKLTDYVSPVCLPQEPDSNVVLSDYGSLGEVVGFGYSDTTNTQSSLLRYAKLELQPPRTCVNALDYIPSSSQLCAGFNKSDPRAVCMGDSGGGLYFKYGPNGRERYTVEGIVSFGDRIAHLRGICRNFGIFTRVLHFRQWIDQQLDMIHGGDTIISSPPTRPVILPVHPLLPSSRTYTRPVSTTAIARTATTRPPVTHAPVTRPPVTRPPQRYNVAQPQRSNYFVAPTSTTSASFNVIQNTGGERSSYHHQQQHQQLTQTVPVKGTSLQQQVLDLHNYYRSLHGAPPLTLSVQLNYDAQNWAESLIGSRSRLGLMKGKGYGQNAFEFKITHGTEEPEKVIDKAVTSWYDSKSLYNPASPKHSSWTQLVWKNSTELGVGLASQNGRTVVIAFYLPAGNVRTRSGSGKYYHENVQL